MRALAQVRDGFIRFDVFLLAFPLYFLVRSMDELESRFQVKSTSGGGGAGFVVTETFELTDLLTSKTRRRPNRCWH